MTLEEISSSSVYTWYSNIAVIMQYTGYTNVSASDVPTYACVGTRDGIADYRTMESRLAKLNSLGIPMEFHAYEGLGHGFGLGTGTVAEGWIEDALAFWEAQAGTQGAKEKNTLLTASPTPDEQLMYGKKRKLLPQPFIPKILEIILMTRISGHM